MTNNVESAAVDVLEHSVDDSVTKKEVSAHPSDPRTYKCDKVCLIAFQVEKLQNTLRAVLQNHGDDLLKSLLASKYQNGAGLMIVAIAGSEKFDSVNVRDMLEHIRKELSLRKVCSCWSSVFQELSADVHEMEYTITL